jgi:hypothetical protein
MFFTQNCLFFTGIPPVEPVILIWAGMRMGAFSLPPTYGITYYG